jgi:hypothetical protein
MPKPLGRGTYEALFPATHDSLTSKSLINSSMRMHSRARAAGVGRHVAPRLFSVRRRDPFALIRLATISRRPFPCPIVESGQSTTSQSSPFPLPVRPHPLLAGHFDPPRLGNPEPGKDIGEPALALPYPGLDRPADC